MSIYGPKLDERMVSDLMADFPADDRILHGVAPDERELWLEEVAYKIAEEAGESGLEFLMAQVSGADEARLRGILLGLSCAGGGWLAQRRDIVGRLLLGFLGDPRPLVVAGAIDTLRQLGFHEAESQVVALLRHESPYVVGSVLRFLTWHDPARAKPVLLEALSSPEPVIRSNAIDELDELPCAEALPQIRGLLNDKDANVRQAAETAVRNLEELEAEDA